MTGRPRLRAAQVELAHRAQALRDDGDLEATELDYVCQWIENGDTIVSLAADLTIYSNVDIERSQVMKALTLQFGAETVALRLKAARPGGGHALNEQAIAITDRLGKDAKGNETFLSREDIARAKLQTDVRLWTAGKWNPAELGDQKQANLTINVQSLHLDALRARNATGQTGASDSAKSTDGPNRPGCLAHDLT